jgi:hypothetical protein
MKVSMLSTFAADSATIFDLLADPFERGDKSLLHDEWFIVSVLLTTSLTMSVV